MQPVGALGGLQRLVEVVEDVVGAPGEPVERVHGWTLLWRKQPSRQEERAPVLRVERAAATVSVAQRRIAHTGGMEFGTDHFCTTR